ncbi:unnamed protein product [Meganyctiphanes norvegica]|uniref:Uncharacterized protein n=1 Tax=Meganyctiphanes norvegica TaxID=48144 RepID=A0AAV2RAN3_MEGNR
MRMKLLQLDLQQNQMKRKKIMIITKKNLQRKLQVKIQKQQKTMKKVKLETKVKRRMKNPQVNQRGKPRVSQTTLYLHLEKLLNADLSNEKVKAMMSLKKKLRKTKKVIKKIKKVNLRILPKLKNQRNHA